MSPKQTMSVAQRLYEGIDLGGGEREGLITYMRTDSVNLADKALHDAAALIRARWGASYHREHRYKTKSKVAQEAHEAIRPTEIVAHARPVERVPSRARSWPSTRLVWQRTVASQMADAVLDRTTVDLAVGRRAAPLLAAVAAPLPRQRLDPPLPRLHAGVGRRARGHAAAAARRGQRLAAGPAAGAPRRARRVAGATAERHETRPPAATPRRR